MLKRYQRFPTRAEQYAKVRGDVDFLLYAINAASSEMMSQLATLDRTKRRCGRYAKKTRDLPADAH